MCNVARSSYCIKKKTLFVQVNGTSAVWLKMRLWWKMGRSSLGITGINTSSKSAELGHGTFLEITYRDLTPIYYITGINDSADR